jgi:trehalose-6-phosphatase
LLLVAQAKRLSKELRTIYGASHHVKVTLKKGFVELHPRTLDKGLAVNAAVEQLTHHWQHADRQAKGKAAEIRREEKAMERRESKDRQGEEEREEQQEQDSAGEGDRKSVGDGGADYDFVLCVGDDMTDEPMFQVCMLRLI